MGIGAELAAPENRNGGDRVIIAGRDSLKDSVNQVGQEIIRPNMNMQPTLTERPGLPVRVIVNRDMVLRPCQPLFFVCEGRDEHVAQKKLRLGPLPKTESVKLTFACPASLNADLDHDTVDAAHPGLRRNSGCGDVDSEYARCIHGGESRVQEIDIAENCITAAIEAGCPPARF